MKTFRVLSPKGVERLYQCESKWIALENAKRADSYTYFNSDYKVREVKYKKKQTKTKSVEHFDEFSNSNGMTGIEIVDTIRNIKVTIDKVYLN